MTNRKLTLKKETLADLTRDELREVVGGQYVLPTTPVKECLNDPSRGQTCIDTWCPCTPAGVPNGA
jgi:hypothetical protein